MKKLLTAMACAGALLASDTPTRLETRGEQVVALATTLRANKVSKILCIPNKDDSGCIVLIPDRERRYGSVIILGKNDLQGGIVGAQIRLDQEIPVEIEPVYPLTDNIIDSVIDRLVKEKMEAGEKK